MAAVIMVKHEDIVGIWPTVRPHLMRALEYSSGRYTEAGILFDLARGNQTLWIVINDESKVLAAFTLKVAQYDAKRAMIVHLMGGEGIADWEDGLFEAIYQHAKKYNCDSIEVQGRPAWDKLLGDRGWKKSYVVMEMEI